MKVCWNITSKCNKNCVYCFKFSKNDLTFQQNVKILNKLKDLNVNRISWTGGEPFLYSNLKELLKISKEYNILNYVNTNASLLNENNLKENLQNIDRLIISLDFVDDELNTINGIGENYFQHVKKILKLVKEIKYDIEIQINTVVFSKNIQLIDDVYNEICKYEIDYWKIIKFFPIRGKALYEKEKLNITDDQFEELFSKYENKKQNFKIIMQDSNVMNERHIIVLSSGELIYSEDFKDVKGYNILTD